MIRAQDGDDEAFAELVRETAVGMASVGLILGDPALAEDAVQDVYLRAWKESPRLRVPGAFVGWLRRLNVTASRDAARQQVRWRRPGGDRATHVEDLTGELADRDEMAAGFRRLSTAHEEAPNRCNPGPLLLKWWATLDSNQ